MTSSKTLKTQRAVRGSLNNLNAALNKESLNSPRQSIPNENQLKLVPTNVFPSIHKAASPVKK
jgi:hypothetical protein